MNVPSDEEIGLSNGDLIKCDDCGMVMSVDAGIHICQQGTERREKEIKDSNERYFGNGQVRVRQYLVTIVSPDTEEGFSQAWNDMSTYAPEQSQGVDEMLQIGWSVEEL